jgi:hypothetical protein
MPLEVIRSNSSPSRAGKRTVEARSSRASTSGDALLLFPPEERKPRSFTTIPVIPVAAVASNEDRAKRPTVSRLGRIAALLDRRPAASRWMRPVRIRIALAAPRFE